MIDKTAEPIAEKSTPKITFTVKDENGAAIAGGSLVTLTATLYDETTGAIVNSVSGLDILGANGGTTPDANGVGSWRMRSADNQIVGTREIEVHVLELHWTYTGGGAGKERLRLAVENYVKVT